MSYQIYNWNKSQVLFHNASVPKIQLRTPPESPCFKQYMCDRSTCINDSAHCNYNGCNDKTLNQHEICKYENRPSANVFTYDLFTCANIYNSCK